MLLMTSVVDNMFSGFVPIFVISVFGMVFFIGISMVIAKIFSQHKKDTDATSSSSSPDILSTLIGEPTAEDITCEYCGTVNNKDAKKCAGCGASIKRKKK